MIKHLFKKISVGHEISKLSLLVISTASILCAATASFADNAVDQGFIDSNQFSANATTDPNAPDGPPSDEFTQSTVGSHPEDAQARGSQPRQSRFVNNQSLSSSGTEERVTTGLAPLSFIFDHTSSPIVGADALISALHGYMAIDDALIPDSVGITDFSMVLGRLGKFALENILFSWGMVAQHEIFGHGARAREFHMRVLAYRVTPWTGFTAVSAAKYNSLSPSERIAFTTGGVEATYILARELRSNWLERNCIDEREAHFYLLNALDQTDYVLSTRRHHKFFWSNDEHDILSYINQVNRWYGRTALTGSNLRRKILIDFLDPYVFFSLYSIGLYLADGTQAFEYPMLPLGPYRYLPGFRVALAPYGPEYQFINYLQDCEQTIQATFRYGNTLHRQSYGFALNVGQIWVSDLMSVDGRFDIWRQPKLFTQKAFQAGNKLGGAISLIGKYQINQCLGIFGQLGYKTTGYMPGEELKHAPIIRAGFAMRM